MASLFDGADFNFEDIFKDDGSSSGSFDFSMEEKQEDEAKLEAEKDKPAETAAETEEAVPPTGEAAEAAENQEGAAAEDMQEEAAEEKTANTEAEQEESGSVAAGEQPEMEQEPEQEEKEKPAETSEPETEPKDKQEEPKTRKRAKRKKKADAAEEDDAAEPAETPSAPKEIIQEFDQEFLESLHIAISPEYAAQQEEINQKMNEIDIRHNMSQSVYSVMNEKVVMFQKLVSAYGDVYKTALAHLEENLMEVVKAEAKLKAEGTEKDKEAMAKLALANYRNPRTGKPCNLLQYHAGLKDAVRFFTDKEKIAVGFGVALSNMVKKVV